VDLEISCEDTLKVLGARADYGVLLMPDIPEVDIMMTAPKKNIERATRAN